MQKKGIDVSYAQGEIDWAKVAAAGIDFAIIRAGYPRADGTFKVDTRFHENMKEATAAGLDVGVYVYNYAVTALAARKAATHTLELIKEYRLTYPVVFDIEDPVNKALSPSVNNEICKAFLSTVEAAGYYGMLYTFKSFAETHLNMSGLAMYDVCIAQWADKCTYAGNYGIWQYSNTGRVDGIQTDVDLNYAYQDYAAIIRAAGLNGFSGEDKDDIVGGLEEQARYCDCCADKEFFFETIAAIERLWKRMKDRVGGGR